MKLLRRILDWMSRNEQAVVVFFIVGIACVFLIWFQLWSDEVIARWQAEPRCPEAREVGR